MPSPRLLFTAAPLLLATALALTGCSGAAAEPETTSTPAPTVGAGETVVPSAEPEPDDTPQAAPPTPTCTEIVSAATIAGFESVGWTHREEPFRIGSMVVEDGIQCSWADFAVPGGPLQVFGWAPLEGSDAKAAQRDLTAAGWLRESGDEGVYITENPQMALTRDEDGYGMTYLFGDGWVTLADTKQSLVLVERPQA
ncbi:hypothetical protein [Microbacterium wangruii]|uniref:hypothetical protein n=1 Tax=Microbacterium wangruii TaxID=3049073 RepID=UPI00256ED0B1|nr:hypothetical protein [Microbacterium sp. zg-Y1211]MDL5487690.1 hypothetical protein [Microbacterium sp. zg-Y1211]